MTTMTAPTFTSDATATRDARAVEVLDLLARIESAVRQNVAQPATWSLAGDLGHTHEQLAQLAEFLNA
jgi:hypothetical protein